MEASVKEITNIDGNTTYYSLNGIKSNAQTQVEHEVDLILKNLEPRFLGQLYDGVLVTTDRSCKQSEANEDRINLKNGLLFRKYY